MDIDELRTRFDNLAKEAEGKFSVAYVIKPIRDMTGEARVGVFMKGAPPIEVPMMVVLMLSSASAMMKRRGLLAAADHLGAIANKLARDIGLTINSVDRIGRPS